MSVFPKSLGEWRLDTSYKKTASVALSANSIVDFPASPTGYFVAGTSTTTKFLGLLQSATASGDADYALNTVKPVMVPLVPRAKVIATAASAVATDVGTRCDLTDAVTVNRGASSVGRFVITKVPSATSVEGYFLEVAQTGAA